MSKLQKQFLTIGIIFVLCIALGIVYFVATKSDTEDNTVVEVRDEFGVLMDGDKHFILDPIEVSDIKKIHVHNLDDDYTLLQKTGGAWAFEGVSGFELVGEKVPALRTDTRFLKARELVKTADLKNLSKYGIDKNNPSVYFDVEHKGGEYRIIVGDKTPDDKGYYAVLEGRDALYILPDSLQETVLRSLNEYISPIIYDKIETAESGALENLSLYRGSDLFVRIDSVKDALTYGNFSSYRVSHPVNNHATSYGLFESVLDTLSKLVCTKTVAFGSALTEEKLAELGFVKSDDEHTCDYTLNLNYPKQKISLHIKTLEEEYLIWSEHKNIVVTADKESFKFLDWELISWVSPEIYMLDIFSVSTMELTTPKTSVTFSFSGEDDISIKAGETPIDAEAFKMVYKELMNLVVTDWAEEPEASDELMRLVVTLESGEVLDYRFVSATAVNSFYSLNGEGRFFVERQKLMALREKLEGFAQ